MPFIQSENKASDNQQLRPLRDEEESTIKIMNNFRLHKSKSKLNVCTNVKNFNFIAILSALIAVMLVLIALINSFIVLKTWEAVMDNQHKLDMIFYTINTKLNVTYCSESDLELQNVDCPICETFSQTISGAVNTTIISEVVQVIPEKEANSSKKDPLSLLTELAQRGAKFTCDVVCKDPLVIKSFLKVNSESETWEGIGDGNMSAKQDAAFKALKELYPPHILADISYEKKNQSIQNCSDKPVQVATNSTNKINKKC